MTAAHGDATLSVGASAGSTMLWPLDTPATVLERADRAMYTRKTSRRSAIAADSAGCRRSRLTSGFHRVNGDRAVPPPCRDQVTHLVNAGRRRDLPHSHAARMG